MTAVLLAVGALVVMEPITTRSRTGSCSTASGWAGTGAITSRHARALEANDWFPIVFAAATIVVLVVGAYVGGGEVLTPLGIGVTAYGACYLLVHDVVIHRRIGWLRPPPDFLARTGAPRTTCTTSTRAQRRTASSSPIVPADLHAKGRARRRTAPTARGRSGRPGRAPGRDPAS